MLLVARQLAVDTMRLGCVLAQALDTVGLIGLKVALEPIPVARILVGALPRQNVRGDAVQEHAVVANDHRAARELEQRRFERGQRLDVEVVRGLVEEQQVAALLERERQVQTIALTTGEYASTLLLVLALKAKVATYARLGTSVSPTIMWSRPSETTSHRFLSGSMPERFWST